MFCAYTRPRYQVSIYRTIGPLVYIKQPISFVYNISAEIKILFSLLFHYLSPITVSLFMQIVNAFLEWDIKALLLFAI